MEKEKTIKVKSVIVRSTKAVANEVNPLRYAKFIAKQNTYNLVKDMFSFSKRKTEKQTFDEAILKYGISEKTLIDNSLFFTRAKIGFLLVSSALFLYSIVLMLNSSFLMSIALLINSFVFTILGLTYGLRAYQIKIRELCSFKQYLKSIFTTKEKS
ncbi:hypothetical protein ABZR37_03445 [Achromobacter ruhlandii]|uniref:hypothetical protein n=1 Tax=Achromobacter TaxID=222 RepID=UPI00105DF41D|nr:hypothetical protein [Achromobacter xylosoxidans]